MSKKFGSSKASSSSKRDLQIDIDESNVSFGESGVWRGSNIVDSIFFEEARNESRRKKLRGTFEKISGKRDEFHDYESRSIVLRALNELREFDRVVRGGRKDDDDDDDDDDDIRRLTARLNESNLFVRIENFFLERLTANDRDFLEANDCSRLAAFEEPYLLGSWRAFNVRETPFLYYRLIVDAVLRVDKHLTVTSRLYADREYANEGKKSRFYGRSTNLERRKRENLAEKRRLSIVAKNILDEAKIALLKETRFERESDSCVSILLHETTERFGEIAATLTLSTYDVKLCVMKSMCAKLLREYSSWSVEREFAMSADSRRILSESKIRRNALRDKIRRYERERRVRETEARDAEIERAREDTEAAYLEKTLVETLTELREELERARALEVEWSERLRIVEEEIAARVEISIHERETAMIEELRIHRDNLATNAKIRETEIKNLRSQVESETRDYEKRSRNLYTTIVGAAAMEDRRRRKKMKDPSEDDDDDDTDEEERLSREETRMRSLLDFAENLLRNEKLPSESDAYTTYEKIWRWNSFVRNDVFSKFLSIVDADDDLKCNLACSALREKWQYLINNMNKFHRLSVTKSIRYKLDTDYREKISAYDKWRNEIAKETTKLKNTDRLRVFDLFTDPRYRSYSRTTLYRIARYNLPWIDLTNTRRRLKDVLSFKRDSVALKYLTLCLSANIAIDSRLFANCALSDETYVGVKTSSTSQRRVTVSTSSSSHPSSSSSSSSSSSTSSSSSSSSTASGGGGVGIESSGVAKSFTGSTGLLTTTSSGVAESRRFLADSSAVPSTSKLSSSSIAEGKRREEESAVETVQASLIAPDNLRSFAEEEIVALNRSMNVDPQNWRCLGILYLLSKAIGRNAQRVVSEPTITATTAAE